MDYINQENNGNYYNINKDMDKINYHLEEIEKTLGLKPRKDLEMENYLMKLHINGYLKLRDKYGKFEVIKITEKGYNQLGNHEILKEPDKVRELDEKREKLLNYKPFWKRTSELLKAGVISQEIFELLNNHELDPIDMVNFMLTTPTGIHDVNELTENDIVETCLSEDEIDEIYRLANLEG